MYKYLLCISILFGLFFLWTYKGIAETGIHVDLARDLNELSNLWVGKMVWLGPATSANFPASPIYYYLLFPGLLLSGGNALSLVFSQAFFAFLALGSFAYFQLKKSFISMFLVILTIGLSPWWINSSALPWNGHMYVAWVFLALTSLYFRKPIFISALLFGIAIAIDPVAILAVPILFYEWGTSGKRLKNLIYLLLGLLLPWTPILLFEIITRGFLTRHWLEYPSYGGLIFSPGTSNITKIVSIIGVSEGMAVISWLIAFLIGSKRDKYWLIVISILLILLIFVSPLRQYYLLGLVSALSFIVAIILSSRTIGRIILIAFILSYIQVINLPPFVFGDRSVPRMDNTVNTFIQKSSLDKTKKYAVVSVRDRQNSTPQADDYRFFLRTKGINVLSIDESPQADILLLFIEVPNFNFQNFDDWHIQRFGNRRFLSNQNINGLEVIMYGR